MKKYISVLIALALLTGCSGGAGFPEESVVYESETTTAFLSETATVKSATEESKTETTTVKSVTEESKTETTTVKSVTEESETETAAAEAVTETSEAETSVQTTSETTQPPAETEETVSETTRYKHRARDVNPPHTEVPSANGVIMGVKRGDYDCDEHAYNYLIRSQEQLDIYNGYTENSIIYEDIDFEKYSIASFSLNLGSSGYKYSCNDLVIDGRYIIFVYGVEGVGASDDMARTFGYALIPNELLTEESYHGWRTPGEEYDETEGYIVSLSFDTEEYYAAKICAYAEKYGAKDLFIWYGCRKGGSPYSYIGVNAEFSDKESAEEFKKLFENGIDAVPYDKAENGTPSGFRAIECGVGFEGDITGEYDYETIHRGLERIGKNCLVEKEELHLRYNCTETSSYYSGYSHNMDFTYHDRCIGRAWRADISTPEDFDQLCEDMNYFPYGNGYFEFNIEAFFVFE